MFESVEIEAQQADRNWNIALDGPAMAGQVSVPLDIGAQNPIVLDMQRLWLNRTTEAADEVSDEPDDPRQVPSAEVTVGDFQLRGMQFGALEMSVRNVSGGIRVNPIKTRAPAFRSTVTRPGSCIRTMTRCARPSSL